MSGYKSPAHQHPDPKPSADISTVVFDGIGPGLSTEPGGQKTMQTHRATLFSSLHVHGEHLHSTCIRASSGEVSTDTWSVFDYLRIKGHTRKLHAFFLSLFAADAVWLLCCFSFSILSGFHFCYFLPHADK